MRLTKRVHEYLLPMPTAGAGVGFYLRLFVCFCGTISHKPDASRITKLNIEMFHDES